MHPHLGSAVGLLIALTSANLSAQQAACTLLTPGDIEPIIGGKLMEPHQTDMVIPEGPQKGQTVNGCMWSVPSASGMVSVSLMPAPQGASREAGMAKLEQVYADLRAQHWTEEKKSFPDGSCSIMTPPPGKQDVPIMSGCIAELKGLVVSSAFLSPKQKLSMAETRAIMDKVISHMHRTSPSY
jgi:hypothetical protein